MSSSSSSGQQAGGGTGAAPHRLAYVPVPSATASPFEVGAWFRYLASTSGLKHTESRDMGYTWFPGDYLRKYIRRNELQYILVFAGYDKELVRHLDIEAKARILDADNKTAYPSPSWLRSILDMANLSKSK